MTGGGGRKAEAGAWEQGTGSVGQAPASGWIGTARTRRGCQRVGRPLFRRVRVPYALCGPHLCVPNRLTKPGCRTQWKA